ncbi:MAG: hypothetical protein ACXWI6_03255 [Burkholderiales bacterium]
MLADLQHLCDVSDVSAVIDASRVPLSAAVRAVLEIAPERIAAVLTRGDDYEILFTAHAAAAAELSRAFDVPITAIGSVASRPAGQRGRATVLNERGQLLTLDRSGWTHF